MRPAGRTMKTALQFPGAPLLNIFVERELRDYFVLRAFAKSGVEDLLAQAEADRTISVPAAPPAAVENHRVRFSGYFSKTEAQALSKIRAAFPGDRLPDNLLVRAAVRAAQPDMLRAHLAAIQAEDRRRI